MQSQPKRARVDPAAATAATAVCQLFRLPRELLELVAAYFSRNEAVPVLAVNSTLHEIFAERVWRCIDTYLDNRRVIPPESLLTYGHLVRRMRVTRSIPESIDLAAALPNVTHLWIPFFRLAATVKSSQGTCFERSCFERMCYLGTWTEYADRDALETSEDVAPVLGWIDSRFEAEAGLDTVQWEICKDQNMRLPRNVMDWLQRNSQLSRIHFKLDNEVLQFSGAENGGAESADFNRTVAHCLAEWRVGNSDYFCPAYRFRKALSTIPPVERRHFTFPALRRLNVSTCCYVNVHSLDFGALFPSVRELKLDCDRNICRDNHFEHFSSILAHPWPSVRKLNIYGEFNFEDIVSHFAAVSNVEELSIEWESDRLSSGWNMGAVDLCELDRVLPKLVRLRVSYGGMTAAPQEEQRQQLFRHLRYASFVHLVMAASAIGALVHAPLLTGVCLEHIDFKIDDDVYLSDENTDEDECQDYRENRRCREEVNLDFLDGVTNAAVRTVDMKFAMYRSPNNHDDIFRAMLKCFVRLGACTIRSDGREAMPGLHEEFPAIRFKRIE
ncbi:hypothetical protein GQ42DRAFT_166048 [Ramicandelaber brevisporus]|nr:hypothetical protein GQ42DRAFT_166048 [Ramicandelaber brevisporus]